MVKSNNVLSVLVLSIFLSMVIVNVHGRYLPTRNMNDPLDRLRELMKNVSLNIFFYTLYCNQKWR